jgi:conjugative transposon TraM protein
MEQTHSPKFIRQRKFFTVLPLLTLPFITLFFWALGGGKVTGTQANTGPQGFNVNLPDAYLDKGKAPQDKLAFYEQAERDSAKLQELMRNDPYYKHRADAGKQSADSSRLLGLATMKVNLGTGLNPSPYTSTYMDTNEAKVYNKLDELTKSLNASTEIPPQKAGAAYSTAASDKDFPVSSTEMQRLESLMQNMQSGTGSDDTEMKELDGMLEKVLDIQHPERVQHRLKSLSAQNKGQVFAVAPAVEETPVSLLSGEGADSNSGNRPFSLQHNGFYSLDDMPGESTGPNAIEAVAAETQELVNGSTVKLKLVHDVYINGTLIPGGSFVYGIASLDGERLTVSVNSIRYQNSLFPVSLSVFDLDGLAGIHIPGAISRDAAKQSGDRAIQSLGMTTFDQSLGAQAASAGIELTRSFLSKKVRLIKVTVKAGYQVLLLDDKQKQDQ